ncbi:heterokaryon incompatibility protein-domain-containing protein, partial [Leptodontidium sp. 2 PMI_412]
QIRVLKLHPGTFSSEIRLSLEVTTFTEDHTPDFEAVSYTWGSDDNPTLPVTQNLAEALPHFRYEDRPRVLWIDAICVDQENLMERGHQVKRMSDIYSNAAKVFVWLG